MGAHASGIIIRVQLECYTIDNKQNTYSWNEKKKQIEKQITQSIKHCFDTIIACGGSSKTKAIKVNQILITVCYRCTIDLDVTKEELKKIWF